MRRTRHSAGLSFYEEDRRAHMEKVQQVLSWILLTAAAIGLGILVTWCFGFRVNHIGNSMEPTLADGQNVLVNRLSYKLFSPHRNDIIAFYPGGNEDTHPSIKRVVALPNQTVQIMDGVLVVDGVPESDRKAFTQIEDVGTLTEPLTLGEDEYFVLGDNPAESDDSRSPSIGTISEKSIIGRVWFALPGGGEFGLIH